MHTLACLSQKGGVGKSTIARLMAVAYANAKWRVKIADFNVKQLTSVDWTASRMSGEIMPEVQAQAFSNIKAALRDSDHDIMIFDGKPDSDATSLDIAKESDLIILPAGVSGDDLRPQVKFAHELLSRGIERKRILFVINKVLDSAASVSDARGFIEAAGYVVAKVELPSKTGYQLAQNIGRAINESAFASLNDRAQALADEIGAAMTVLAGNRQFA